MYEMLTVHHTGVTLVSVDDSLYTCRIIMPKMAFARLTKLLEFSDPKQISNIKKI